jgi:hypothetical protein
MVGPIGVIVRFVPFDIIFPWPTMMFVFGEQISRAHRQPSTDIDEVKCFTNAYYQFGYTVAFSLQVYPLGCLQ